MSQLAKEEVRTQNILITTKSQSYLLWKLPEVSRIVLILVIDHMPVRVVRLYALREKERYKLIT